MPDKKSILWFNWKDIKHPHAGGAEIVMHAICKKLIAEGREVTLVTAEYENASKSDIIDGVNIIRIGKSKFLHSYFANRYYSKNLKNKFDVIVEVVNTAPYFINLSKDKERIVLFYHQLAREVWYFETKFPLNIIGFYGLEPLATWISSLFDSKVLTISDSSKNDLMRFGFKQKNISILTEFIENKPLQKTEQDYQKESTFTILFHGSLRQMKRPIEVFKAFAILKENIKKSAKNLEIIQNIQLWVSGGGDQTVLKDYAKEYGFLDKVTFFGRTSEDQKLELMQKSTVLCATSIKEGWGLMVTEANSMGTPAIVYDVDGLRDSSASGNNYTVDPNPQALAVELEKLYEMFTKNPDTYKQKCEEVLENSRKHTIERCYEDFKEIVGI